MKDHLLAMDIHVPKTGKAPYPCILYVHGGGFTQGDKRGRDMVKAIEKGFVFVSMNYLINDRTKYPQMLYDLRDAVRFLRIKADTYQIDPLAIGAVGVSAGGWLITAGSYPNGDFVGHHAKHCLPYKDWLATNKRSSQKSKPKYSGKPIGLMDSHFSFFMTNPDPAYPGISGSLQAVSQDFSWYGKFRDQVNEIAFVNNWCGVGANGAPRPQPGYNAKLDMFLSTSQMTDKKFWGKGVHACGLDSAAIGYDGKTSMTLEERLIEFFTRALVTDRRTPNPEIHPGMRLIDQPTAVQIWTATEGQQVHYTTDGSQPTTNSPNYKAPFTVPPGSTVKAIAIAPGLPPSKVVSATFFKGTPPPPIISPDVNELPPATVGKPYEVQFKAEGRGPYHWYLGGEMGMTKRQKAKNSSPAPRNGLKIDAQTGRLSGTPEYGGRFWVQIQVARSPHGIGALRNYRLVVSGKKGPDGTTTTESDTNVDFASAPATYTQADIDAIATLLSKQGILLHANHSTDGWAMVVDKRSLDRARQAVSAAMAKKTIKPVTFK